LIHAKHLPYSARTIIQQIKSILLVYYVEKHLLKQNIHGGYCLLQLIFPSDRKSTEQLQKGIYYKWFDEEHVLNNNLI
jgi:hypothetical protein